MNQDTKTECGCQPACCDRHLAPVQTQVSSCCDPTAAAAASCGCGSALAEKVQPTPVQFPLKRLMMLKQLFTTEETA
jgi:hypothetical protein